jgi:predicted glutamine amidotransferase
MCRLLLGINYPITKNNLIDFLSQSTNKKNTPGIDNYLDGNSHLDGYGFAYGNFGKQLNIDKSPYFWKQDLKINQILETITKSKPDIIIGHLRKTSSSDKTNGKHINNTHPFTYNNFVIAHNGKIKDFKSKKYKILEIIDDKYKGQIKGSTDTELLFYLILTTIDLYLDYYKDKSYSKSNIYIWSFMTVFDYLVNLSIGLVGNFIFYDGDNVLVIRYKSAIFTDSKLAPSLYLDKDPTSSALIISSEPITTNYKLFQENSYMIL